MHRFHTPYGESGTTSAERFEFTEDAKHVRKHLYNHFVAHGTSPELVTIRDDLELDQDRTWEALHQRLGADVSVWDDEQ